MESTILAAAVGALTMLALVGVVVLLRGRRRSRADLLEQLASSQREADDLRARLDEATARLETVAASQPPQPTRVPTPRRARREVPEYVITDAGEPGAVSAPEPVAVPNRLVLSATVGAPLVKVAAFSHGVRRALAPETRNRIWFEMRREVRASRKRRRQLVKEHLRAVRADERAQEVLR